ncbi:MAG: membrane protein insertase YidC [Bacteroidales bacterium]|nr:membrane protein insertase YidC [Bacteroidales bacterium]MDZ4205137.1 membrane protein insertase YidC [Bacteroidales bacterium]
MNKENIIGLVLIFALLIAYSLFMTPSKEETEKSKLVQDSVTRVHQRYLDSLKIVAEITMARQKATIQTENIDIEDTLIKKAIQRDRYGVFSHAIENENIIFYIESDVLRLGIASKGGRIVSAQLKEYQTFDTLPLQLINADSSLFNLVFFSNNRIIRTQDLYFQPYWYDESQNEADKMYVTGENELSFGMRLYTSNSEGKPNENSFIEFKYTLPGNKYMTGLALNFSGMNTAIDANVNALNLEWQNQLQRQEKNLKTERNTSTVIYRYLSDETGELSETKDGSESLKTRVKWIAFKQQFFTTTLIADDHFLSSEIKSFTQTDILNNHYLKTMRADISIPFQASEQFSVPMQFYLGPNKYNILRSYKLDLERQIPLGWSFFLMHGINRYAVIPVFNFLEGFNLNYGIIILILTILLKIVLTPLTYKTYTSSARMRVLKPEIEELNKKFPNKDDAMKKQQAMMALYKKAGVNPMSGCLPVVFQMPILIALFRFFPSSIELRQQSFLWAHDLSTYDSILDLPFDIPFYGDHVSLFTLLMTISTVAYTYISSKMMDTGQNQMPGMKMMMYLMPIMFLGFFNNYSAGLSYYYLLANLFTFAQMWLIRRSISEDKIRAKIAAYQKKPVKVSGFQKRLEDMAKQKGYKSSKK